MAIGREIFHESEALSPQLDTFMSTFISPQLAIAEHIDCNVSSLMTISNIS